MAQSSEDRIAYLEAVLNILEGNQAQTVRELIHVSSQKLFPDLLLSDTQFGSILRLYGTTVLEALYIIVNLTEALQVDGDVCEFGVAQGRTSGLLAATLLQKKSTKRLWLYDSFEGLPAPSPKDVLINDIFGLGSIGAYEGKLRSPEAEVLHELARVAFPRTQAEICKGWVEALLNAGRYPEKVAFAYLDMDFYQSTADALEVLAGRMPSGGRIVVDDYRFFSAGVETAVTEFMANHAGRFELENPFGLKFVILRRT